MLETCVPWKGHCGNFVFLLIKVVCPGWQGICVNSMSIAVLDVAFLFLGGVQVQIRFCMTDVWRVVWLHVCVYLHETWVLKHSFATTYCMSIRFVFFNAAKFRSIFLHFLKETGNFSLRFIFCFAASRHPGSRASNKSRCRVCTWFDLRKVIASTPTWVCSNNFPCTYGNVYIHDIRICLL